MASNEDNRSADAFKIPNQSNSFVRLNNIFENPPSYDDIDDNNRYLQMLRENYNSKLESRFNRVMSIDESIPQTKPKVKKLE